jgi:hypothetical protein
MDGFVGFEGSAGDALLFRTPGGLFFDEIVGTQRKGGGYVLALAWYKGILQPRSEIDFPDYAPLASTTVGGLSLTEFHGEELVRDLRFFDDTEYTRLREFALSLKRIDPESGSDSHTDVD